MIWIYYSKYSYAKYLWSNMLYLEIVVKICGIFKILIWLPFLIKSFKWAAKLPKPLPIHWKVVESDVFFIFFVLFFRVTQLCLIFQKYSLQHFKRFSLSSNCSKRSEFSQRLIGNVIFVLTSTKFVHRCVRLHRIKIC